MAKKNSTWQCAGTTDSPHDPFDNFGPDCSICGVEKPGKTSLPGKMSLNDKKPPIAAIAAGLVGGIAVLGVGYLLSPNIPGLCGVAQNCNAWQNDLTKAKRNVNDAKAIVANKSASEQEIKDAQKKADEAVKLLASLSQQESMKKDAKTSLDEAKQAQDRLITQLAALGKKPDPRPTPTPTPTPTSGGTSKSPEPPYSPPPVREEPEPPIARVEQPVDRPEPEQPVYVSPVPPPESRPESSATPRQEELIPR